jgi:hypothetical protein
MPSSAMKASPTVSAHAILSRRRRRHDIILIAPLALSPSNFAIFNHRPLEREGWSLRVKRKAPHPPPGRGAKPRARRFELRGETVLGPASIWTSIHRMGETLWLKSCRRNCRRSMTGDHGRCGAGYANGAHDVATSNNSDNWNEGLPLSGCLPALGLVFFLEITLPPSVPTGIMLHVVNWASFDQGSVFQNNLRGSHSVSYRFV